MKGSLRRVLLAGSAIFAGLPVIAAPASAQEKPAAASPGSAPAETADTTAQPTPLLSPETADAQAKAGDIVVTGSRVKRDGFKSPTPETVLGASDIAAKAPVNIADAVNQLPQLAGSATPRQATVTVSSGSAGSNFLNLRGLGVNRTLVLLDGRRVVGANADGRVDVNTLPSSLISRIDIVTGGASAAYGSDAVSGVVNFVLDTRFKGLKLEAQAGVTDYGDDGNTKVDGAFGTSFADDRGHFIVSADYTRNNGIERADSRSWYRGQKIIPNPAYVAGNGQPQLINAANVNLSTATFGGLITSGANRGIQFGAGGAQSRFSYGTLAGMYMLGGQTNDLSAYYSLDIPLEQVTAFGRLSFDVSNAFKPFVEVNYGNAKATALSAYNFYFGNVAIRADNAFLPANLKGQAFSLGTLNADLGRETGISTRELQRYVAGASGDLGGGWSYDVYGQYGRTAVSSRVVNLVNKAKYAQAVDSVVNAAGQIVCRSTLTNPADGCVPYNVFGTGVNTQAAINYVNGVSQQDLLLQESVAAASVQGQPFSTWAGPVSLVFGGEYRDERISGTSDAISQANGYFSANYKPTNGSYNVYEGFVETVVPLLRDSRFGRSLDLNGAYRRTQYSISGGADTWKIGATYQITDTIRLRAVRSRDIRAPNLNELFQGGVVAAAQTVNDPVTRVQQTGFTAITIGNTNLKPEIAQTFSGGVVLTPVFLPGFSLSVDYYNIRIDSAINTLTVQQIVDGCFAGNQVLCGAITRNGTTIVNVNRQPVNINTEGLRGLDIEGSYRFPLAFMGASRGSTLTLRGLATYTDTRYIFDGRTRTEFAGQNSGAIPKWRVNSSVGYDDAVFDLLFTGRWVSAGVYDPAYTSATLADNHIPGAAYFDLSGGVKFGAGKRNGTFFFNVQNLFDKDPVIVSAISQPFLYAPVNSLLYDTIGRTFRVGIRLKL